jgi:hypothetical protein
VIPLRYHSIEGFTGGSNYAIVEKDGKRFIINKSGREFDWMQKYPPYHIHALAGSGLYLVDTSSDTNDDDDDTTRINSKAVMRGDGTVILSGISDATVMQNGLITISRYDASIERNAYGLMAADGTVLQAPAFDYLEMFDPLSTPLMMVRRAGAEDYAIMDKQGRLLTDFDVQSVSGEARSGAWLVKEHRQKRLLLPDGTLLALPADTNEYTVLDDGSVLTASAPFMWALADARGRPVSAWYGQIDYLGAGLWRGNDLTSHDDIFGADGRVLHSLPEGLAAIGLLHNAGNTQSRLLVHDHDYALLDWKHNDRLIKLPPKTARATAGEDGLTSVELGLDDSDYVNGKVVGHESAAFVDMDGNIVTTVAATALRGLQEGLAAAAIMKSPGKGEYPQPRYGMVDRKGRWVIPASYKAIMDVSEGMIWAQGLDGGIVLFNTKGQVLGRRVVKNGREVWVGR